MVKYIQSIEEFNSEITNGTVIVDFYADWCGPCKMLGKVIEAVDGKLQDGIKILKVDTDVHQTLAMQFGVQSIPTVLKFVNGKVALKSVGYIDEDDFIDFAKN